MMNVDIMSEVRGSKTDMAGGSESHEVYEQGSPKVVGENGSAMFGRPNGGYVNDETSIEVDKEPSKSSDGYSECITEVVLRRPVQNNTRPLKDTKKFSSTGDLKNYHKKFEVKENGGNMVLQLVLPNGRPTTSQEGINYLTTTSLDSILGTNHVNDRQRPKSSPLYQGNNSPTTISQTFENATFMNPAYSEFGDFIRNGNYSRMNSADQLTTITESSDGGKPTPPDEKKKAFWDLLTKVLSGFYALFNVTLGLAVYVTDIIETGGTEEAPLALAENFSLFLMVVAFIFILYLTIDISIFMNKKKKYDSLLENDPPNIEMNETTDGNYQLNIIVPESASKKALKHHYCFNKDRHSANFFLKIGAAGFCFGHLIHSGLIIAYKFMYLNNEGYESLKTCGSVTTLVSDILYPFYSFLLLFFIFKYSNIIINRYAALARFGIMHCLSSSLCFWVWTIVRETLEYISINEKSVDSDIYEEYSSPYVTEPYTEDYTERYIDPDDIISDGDYSGSGSSSGDGPIAMALTSVTQKEGAQILNEFVNASVRRFTKTCNDENLSTIYRNYSPYLYPFSVEFSILVVGVLYIVWSNIGICKSEHNAHSAPDRRECKTPKPQEKESNVVVHADCHAANKGIFGGFVVLVFVAVSVILFFIEEQEDGFDDTGFFINHVTSLVVVGCMTVAVLVAYRQITNLDINPDAHNQLDNLLLFACLPAFFFHGIFSVIPAILNDRYEAAINTCLEVAQVLIQTVFIVDGLRRSSNTKSLRNKKPGRELVTFLVICNISMWLLQTFEVKSHSLNDYIYEFYSKVLWSVIGHLCLPFMMFYRFHSAVCIGDIWKHAYEPPGH